MVGERVENESEVPRKTVFGGCDGRMYASDHLRNRGLVVWVVGIVRRCGLFSRVCGLLGGFDDGAPQTGLL